MTPACHNEVQTRVGRSYLLQTSWRPVQQRRCRTWRYHTTAPSAGRRSPLSHSEPPLSRKQRPLLRKTKKWRKECGEDGIKEETMEGSHICTILSARTTSSASLHVFLCFPYRAFPSLIHTFPLFHTVSILFLFSYLSHTFSTLFHTFPIIFKGFSIPFSYLFHLALVVIDYPPVYCPPKKL